MFDWEESHPIPKFGNTDPSMELSTISSSVCRTHRELNFKNRFFTVLIIPAEHSAEIINQFISFYLVECFYSTGQIRVFVGCLFIGACQIGETKICISRTACGTAYIISVTCCRQTGCTFQVFNDEIPCILTGRKGLA